jgi:hypothetical protein
MANAVMPAFSCIRRSPPVQHESFSGVKYTSAYSPAIADASVA